MSVTLATGDVARAQTYPPSAYYPAYNQPYHGYYPQYGAAPAASGYYYYPSPSDPHTGGGTGRAYWGSQKTN
ncbi:MAG TPA: hypothetical protein VFQ90_16960 [Stellaceae bacterium]|nr:hypothetical protein [Stellaceae bacterium]